MGAANKLHLKTTQPHPLTRPYFVQSGALTETAFAVSNGLLSSVNPAEGWTAEWHAAPNACPFCRNQNMRRFWVVAPDSPTKNGDTQIWVGKTNIGRSASLWSRKLGRERVSSELWWAACPCHPNCACTFVLRRLRP